MSDTETDVEANQNYDGPDDSQLKQLHRRLTISNFIELRNNFAKNLEKKISKCEFRELLKDIADIEYEDEEFELLFLKLDLSSDSGYVSWYSFLMHIMATFQAEEIEKYAGQLEAPISRIQKEMKSPHRHPILRITFIPEILQNRQCNHLNGSYITCSRDGIIHFWTIEFEHEKDAVSHSYTLKTIPTWVTDVVSMPDVNILCLSCTERELRFYDVCANKFDLRMVITNLEDYVNTLTYTFYTDIDKESKLIFGDATGRVRLLEFKAKNRGPFRGSTQMPVTVVRYEDFAKGVIPMMTLKVLASHHSGPVVQVAYFEAIHCVLSVSARSDKSMFVCSTKSKDYFYTFHIPGGVSCFTTSTNLQLVITGGRDCFIRTWNPFVSTRATAKLRGHHTEILCLLVQEEGNVLLSMDNERYIKVWDLKEQCCLQTFLGLHSITKKYCPTSYYYNPETRQLFIADIKIYSMEIFPLLNGEFTDGVSHSKEVSVVLYNNLLQVIVTCGYDSVIIVWDPYAGRRQKVIRNAHMKTKHGETLPVEITAAAWNHSQKLLITGATDGTLKIWNFNAGVCYRNMSIQDGCEVCAIVWLKYRILVTGENRVVTEFADGDDASYTSYKNWISRHKDDVLCAVVHQPQTLVTGSYSGEIVFWRLETGQTFGMYNVRDPRRRIQLQYQVENSRSKVNNQMKKNTSSKLQWHSEHNDASKARATVESCEFDLPEYTEKIPIHCMLFLLTRRIEPNTGTLLVSLQNGNIQLWSHHAGGGYLRSFKAKHAPPDYVISMCTDSKNEFLFTGHMSGYLKIWHIINYGQHEEDQVHVCKPLIRLKFPFLLKDFIPGRAKRANKGEGPWLLSSLRCHLKAVTGIVYLEANEIVITSSSDKSVRFWTLGGRYLGTLGTFKPWTNIIPNVPIDPKRETVLPADLQRTASFTTRKVLMNGMVERRSKNKNEEEVQIETVDIDQDDYEKFVENYFKLPKSQTKYRPVKIEDRHVQIAPYSQLNLYEFAEVKRIHTPELLKQIRAQNESVAAEKPKQQIAFKLH